VTFGADPIRTELGGTSVELGGGVSYEFTKSLSAFVAANYAFNIDSNHFETVSGNVGLKIRW
jgi:outer membrane autotransporter protein